MELYMRDRVIRTTTRKRKTIAESQYHDPVRYAKRYLNGIPDVVDMPL
jgi:hypothetical protein